ncbi:hypothetical protein HWV62_5057 [Athelia sp. TMB]|nr:hypothetical protein HWV62_5057 [Athelia sp. TMB]
MADESIKIMRKRKRAQAIDPCLGVYADPSRAHEPRFGTTPTPFDTKDSTKTTDLPSAHSRSHTPSQNTELVSEPAPECLTVETFLRRSAEKSRTKVYGKRRQRVVAALRRESDTDYQGSALTDVPSSPIIEVTPESNSLRRKRVKISERLTRASVRAHGHPANRPLRRSSSSLAAESSSRRALVFREKVPSPLARGSRNRPPSTLVNLRRIPSLQTTLSTSPETALSTQPSRRKPVTEWKMASQPFRSARQEPTRRSFPATKLSPTRVPLAFVPLLDAKASCFSKSNPNVPVSSETPKLLKLPYGSGSRPQTHPILRLVPFVQPSDTRTKRVTFSSQTSSDHGTEPVDGCTSLSPPALDANCSPLAHVLLAPTPIASIDVYAESRFAYSDSLKEATSSLSADTNSVEKKPLRALASFLGGFMETARSATRRQEFASSGSSEKRRKRRSKRISTPQESQSNLLLQPLDLLRAIGPIISANTQSQTFSPNTPALTQTLTADSQLMMKVLKKSSSGRFQTLLQDCFPAASPQATLVNISSHVSLQAPTIPSDETAISEILSALQPQKSQVVLSSSPIGSSGNHNYGVEALVG